MRLIFVLVLAACATPKDVSYSAAYSRVEPWMIERLAVEAAVGEGYQIANGVEKLHFYSFITMPIRIGPADPVEVAFLVQVIFAFDSGRGKKQFTIVVDPRPFEGDHEVGEERLPVGARARARALSDAIRAHARTYEAPI